MAAWVRDGAGRERQHLEDAFQPGKRGLYGLPLVSERHQRDKHAL
jgi:hypothetical protein